MLKVLKNNIDNSQKLEDVKISKESFIIIDWIRTKIDFILSYLNEINISNQNNIDELEPREKFKIFVCYISQMLIQIINWEELKSCKCSYYPLKGTIEAALKWEIWEKYRGLILDWEDWKKIDLALVESLAYLIAYNKL